MPITCIEIFGPHLSWNGGRRSLKFVDLATGYSAMSPCFVASSTCGESKIATSKGGVLPLAATSRETWSVPRMIDCVTEPPVAFSNAGLRMVRWASFQVPGKVAATSVPLCARAYLGIKAAPPSAARVCSSSRRVR